MHINKCCKDCNTLLIVGTNISKSNIKNRNYLCNSCKAARKREWRKKNPMAALDTDLQKYGISSAEYMKMLKKQGNVCAFCRKFPWGNSRQQRLCVDHCKMTGRIRALLCDPCNRALGMLGDTAEAIQNVIDYLEKPDVRDLIKEKM